MHVLGFGYEAKRPYFFMMFGGRIATVRIFDPRFRIWESKKFSSRRLNIASYVGRTVTFIFDSSEHPPRSEMVGTGELRWSLVGLTVMPVSSYYDWTIGTYPLLNHLVYSYFILNSVFGKKPEKSYVIDIHAVLTALRDRSVSYDISEPSTLILNDIVTNSQKFVDKKIFYARSKLNFMHSKIVSYKVLNKEKYIKELSDAIRNICIYVQSNLLSVRYHANEVKLEDIDSDPSHKIVRADMITDGNLYAWAEKEYLDPYLRSISQISFMAFYKIINNIMMKKSIDIEPFAHKIMSIDIEHHRIKFDSFSVMGISHIMTLYNQYTRKFLRFFSVYIYFEESVMAPIKRSYGNLIVLFVGNVEKMYDRLIKIPKKDLKVFILQKVLNRLSKVTYYEDSYHVLWVYTVWDLD